MTLTGIKCYAQTSYAMLVASLKKKKNIFNFIKLLISEKKVTGEWRRLHNEGLNDLYSSPNIVAVIKWRRMNMD